jgi:hypothetical protein
VAELRIPEGELQQPAITEAILSYREQLCITLIQTIVDGVTAAVADGKLSKELPLAAHVKHNLDVAVDLMDGIGEMEILVPEETMKAILAPYGVETLFEVGSLGHLKRIKMVVNTTYKALRDQQHEQERQEGTA